MSWGNPGDSGPLPSSPLVARRGLVAPRASHLHVEMGAGKGTLGQAIATAFPGAHITMIERSSVRGKVSLMRVAPAGTVSGDAGDAGDAVVVARAQIDSTRRAPCQKRRVDFVWWIYFVT